jgi:hypothetical protein
MSQHMVKKHKWIHGVLESSSHFFDSFEEAKLFLNTQDADTLKIFNANGELVHESVATTNTSIS